MTESVEREERVEKLESVHRQTNTVFSCRWFTVRKIKIIILASSSRLSSRGTKQPSGAVYSLWVSFGLWLCNSQQALDSPSDSRTEHYRRNRLRRAPFSVSPNRLFALCSAHRCHLKPQDTCPFVWHFKHTRTLHTHRLKTSGGFCPVIWHIFDVESKKTKWESEEGEEAILAFHSSERHSLLSTPVYPSTPHPHSHRAPSPPKPGWIFH